MLCEDGWPTIFGDVANSGGKKRQLPESAASVAKETKIPNILGGVPSEVFEDLGGCNLYNAARQGHSIPKRQKKQSKAPAAKSPIKKRPAAAPAPKKTAEVSKGLSTT